MTKFHLADYFANFCLNASIESSVIDEYCIYKIFSINFKWNLSIENI